MEYPEEFERLWSIYPKRCGGNPKIKAFKAYKARLKDGYSYESILNGLTLYAEFCRKTGRINSEYVLQAATFFGPDERFLDDWRIPNHRKDELKGMSREQQINYKAAKLGLTAKLGETWDQYAARINSAWYRQVSGNATND